MPYIKSDDNRREALRHGDFALTAGELNYQIFYYIKHQTKDSLQSERVYFVISGFVEQFLGEKRSYQKYNDITGCLIRCYKELERRLNIDAEFLLEIAGSYNDEIAKYEDKKINENGDVE